MSSSTVFLISSILWTPMVVGYALLTSKGIEYVFSPLGPILLGIIGIILMLVMAGIVAQLYERDISKSIISFLIITIGFAIMDIMGLYFYYLNSIIFH
jgi:zinc transporter ZupT